MTNDIGARKLRRRAAGHQSPALQDVAAVGNRRCLPHVLLHRQYRGAGVGDAPGGPRYIRAWT
jgi:hypothetical protein